MELLKNDIGFYSMMLHKTSVYEETSDTIVPDSFPDAMRVIGAFGTASVKDESMQNDRALISGTIKCVVLYQPENEEGIKHIEVPISFAHIEESKGITTDSEGNISCRVLSVDAKIVNSRKIAITATISLSDDIYNKKNVSVCEDIMDDEYNIEILRQKKNIVIPTNIKRKGMNIMEDIQLKGYDPNMEILCHNADIEVADTKQMPGKLIIKGDAILETIALLDNSIVCLENKIPFTNIIDIDTDGQKVSVFADVKDVDYEMHDDGNISIGVSADAFIKGYEEHTISSIMDMYQTSYELKTDASHLSIDGTLLPYRQAFNEEVSLTAGMKVKDILSHKENFEGVRSGNASYVVQVFFTSDDNQIYSMTRRVSFPVCEDADVYVTPQSLDVRAQVSGDSNVKMTFSGAFEASKAEELRIINVDSVEVDTEKPKKGYSPVTLVLKYVDKDESLWNIAKNYNTTTEEICSANGLSDNVKLSGQMLLIPIK